MSSKKLKSNSVDGIHALEQDTHKMNLYSRQIGEYGLEAMGKLIKMRVLIVGMRGLGVEIAKNLVLAGPGAVSVFDPEFPVEADCGVNFFISSSKNSQRETRGQLSAKELQKLNRLVDVSNLEELSEDVVSTYHCMVLTNKVLPSEAERWNSYCRSHQIGFIQADVLGACGFAFVDFGDSFLCRDLNGETVLSRVIEKFTSVGTQTQVTIVDDGRRHNLDESDHDGFVRFEEVTGPLGELLSDHAFKISHVKSGNRFDPRTFSIDVNSSQIDVQGVEGRFTQVKMPVAIHHVNLHTSRQTPSESSFLFTDGAKFGRAQQLHVGLQALWQFHETHKQLPVTESHFMECLDSVRSKENFDETVVRSLCAFSAVELQPLDAFFGGVVAQEIVKLTGKYTPLNQWLHVDCFEVLNSHPGEFQPGSRQGDLIRLLGEDVVDKLKSISLFQVGCGALGCEFLKNFALLGVAEKEGAVITVTDNDRIEVSNLSRQFLFREENVGQSKSMAATAAVQHMNPAIHVSALELLVSSQTESTFSDAFFQRQFLILNALDNVQARNYVDSRCVFNEKPLLESGTLGTKCNVQVILPHLTQSYTDGPKDAQSADIPMCTLRNFPSEIEHCIEWARARFTDLLTVTPTQVCAFQKDPQEFLSKLRAGMDSPSASEVTNLREVVNMVELVLSDKNTKERCAQDALAMFYRHFRTSVEQLIANYPEDTLDSTGKKFWSGTKRFPQAVVELDVKDEIHATFMIAMTNLLMFNRGLSVQGDALPANDPCRTMAYIQHLLNGNVSPPPEPRGSRSKQEEEEEDKDTAKLEFAQLVQKLDTLAGQAQALRQVEPCEFEKDSDLNFHIDFIYACTNMRCWNYRIKFGSRHQVKMIAGKIIPALATTTASVCGLVMVEMLKLVQGKPLDQFKDSSNSLGVNGYFFSEPTPPNKAKNEYDAIEMCEVICEPPGFTKWDKVKIEASRDCTLQEFLTQLGATKYTVTLLAHPNSNIASRTGYGKFLYESAAWQPEMKKVYESRLTQKLSQVLEEVYGPEAMEGSRIQLESSQEDAEGNPVKFPTVVWIVL